MYKKLLDAVLPLRYLIAFASFLIVFQALYTQDQFINPEAILFDNSIEVVPSPTTKTHSTSKIKPWTMIIYMAADNDLRAFAARNIKQMATIGSNKYINIVAQIDIKITGNHKITRRYYIEKDRIVHTNIDDPNSQKMDSGDSATLISCCKWAIENYPAQDYALVLWNHGTGVIDPIHGRVINPIELFSFNPNINKLELDRTIGFIDLIDGPTKEQRGICWDDSTGHYLTNQKLEHALETISKELLQEKKISILGFDACLMSMLEIGNIVKPYVDIMVGSQEVELGTGWDYSNVLKPFINGTIDKYELAQNIVYMYEQTYSRITNDYTQSAIDLTHIDKLEQNAHNIANLLEECLQKQINGTVKKAIWSSHSKSFCTHFDEPSYVDMHHLYTNLEQNLNSFKLTDLQQEKNLKKALKAELKHGKSIISELVLANRAGKNLHKAKGISIYFPERRIHSSYPQTKFAAKNNWYNFLSQYLLMR